jgi:hypothetical protein
VVGSTVPLGPFRAGDYGIPGVIQVGGASGANQALAAGTYNVFPFSVPAAITVHGVSTSRTQTTAGNLRAMIFDAAAGYDGTLTLVHDLGVLDCSTAGDKFITGLNAAVPPGDYALVYQADAAISLQVYRNLRGSFSIAGGVVNQFPVRVNKTGTYGPAPSTLGSLNWQYHPTGASWWNECGVFLNWSVD